MTKQTIGIGSIANDGTGDPIRTSFTKVNANFDELYAADDNRVVGPASATDDTLVKFDGTTGKLVKQGPTITAFGASLLDDADAATARTTLGVNTSSELAVETKTLTNKTLTAPVISTIVNSGTLTLPTATGTIALTSDITGTNSGTNTGDQSIFKTIAVAGQSDVVADSTTDTLTLVAGSNVTITTNATTDTITINASAGGGSGLADGDYGEVVVSGSGTALAVDVLTTRGDIFTRGASANARLAIGAAGTVPFSDGTDLGYVAGIPSIATLTAAKALTAGGYTAIYVQGRSSAGDGYQGLFRWSSSNLSTSVTADTKFAVYIPPNSATSGASGAWVRVYDGRLNSLWFGAVGDGTTDDKLPLQAWLDLGNFLVEPLFLPAKTFKTTGTLVFYSDTAIIGASFRNSIIKGGSITAGVLRSDAYNTARRYRTTFRDFTIDNTAKTAAGSVGLDLRNVSEAHVERVLAINCETGYQLYADAGGSLGCFYNRLINCEAVTCVTGAFFGQAATSGGTNENVTFGLRINDVTNGIQHSDGSHNGHYHPAIETFTGTGIAVSGTEANLQIVSPRIENSGGVGTGINLGSSVTNPTVFAPSYIGLSTNITDSSTSTVRLDSATGLKFGGGTLFSKIVKTTATIDYPSIAANASNDQLVSVSGASNSMMSMVMPGAGIEAGLSVTPIPTAGGVYMRIANCTTGAINPASMTVTVLTFFQ